MENIFHYLSRYRLSKRDEILPRVLGMNEQTLDRFIESYISLVLAQTPVALTPAQSGAIDIYPDSWATQFPIRIILQLALYADRIYVHDPLLDLAFRWQTLDFDWEYVFRHPSGRAGRVAAFRAQLAATIENLVLLRPLQELGVVQLLPSRLTQQIRRPDLIYADDVYGPVGSASTVSGGPSADAGVPPELVAYCAAHLHATPAELIHGYPHLLQNEPLTPRRMVGIHFDNEHALSFRALTQIAQASGASDDDTGDTGDTIGTISMSLNLGQPQLIDAATFEHWVRGEKWKYVRMRMHRLQQDVHVASRVHARFLTPLRASADLLQLGSEDQVRTSQGAKRHEPACDPLAALLHIDLPYFEQATAHSVARARQDEAAFEDFRAALGRALDDIGKQPDDAARRKYADAFVRDVLRAPSARVKQRMNALLRQGLLSGGIVVGSLATFLVTHDIPTAAAGSALVAAAGAVEGLKSLKSAMNMHDQVQQLPGYFYWQATHATRGAK